MKTLTVYGDRRSGNCYKVQLTCDLLNIKYDWVDVDILSGDTQSEAFLAKNPVGKIPTIALPDGRYLWESNAIINYLAHGSKLLPTDTFLLAKMQQWQFFEQYSHEPYLAVARFIKKYLKLPVERQAEYESKQIGGHKALKVMDDQLQTTDYLVGNTLTTADIALYAYTHVAHEGGFDLQQYPAILQWIDRIKHTDSYSAM